MNIILFEETELDRPLALQDERARHVLDVIGCKEGDQFDVGIIDGPRGKARITAIGRNGLILDFHFVSNVPNLFPIHLVIGFVRPPSARRILKDVTTLGASSLHFVVTDRGERSYTESSLWTDNGYKRQLEEGAEQAFCTRIPEVFIYDSLPKCIESIDVTLDRVALDNYEAECALSEWRPEAKGCVLAVGSERGWSSSERDALRFAGFTLANLGQRILRTETACIAGLTLLLSNMGHMH